MFRFTIRDLLWLMVVAALVIGWSVDRFRGAKLAATYRSWNYVLAEKLKAHGEVAHFTTSGMLIEDRWDDGKSSWHPIHPQEKMPPPELVDR